QHHLFEEWFEVSPETARAVNSAERVVAVGTTVVRALESVATWEGRIMPAQDWTQLRIGPERPPRAIDMLITGLHEPQASHFDLLRAFVPGPLLGRAYAEAVERDYLWHEFGDSALIICPAPRSGRAPGPVAHLRLAGEDRFSTRIEAALGVVGWHRWERVVHDGPRAQLPHDTGRVPTLGPRGGRVGRALHGAGRGASGPGPGGSGPEPRRPPGGPPRARRAVRRPPPGPRRGHHARDHALAVAQLLCLLSSQRFRPVYPGRAPLGRPRCPGDALVYEPSLHRARDPRHGLAARPLRTS